MKNSIYIFILGFIVGASVFLVYYRIDNTRKTPTFTYKPGDKIPDTLELCKRALLAWEKQWKSKVGENNARY